MEQGGHLAQINVGRLDARPDDPRFAGFVAAPGRVNVLADVSPSVVWRLQDGKGDGAPALRPHPTRCSR